jgi:hypothetical protein
MLLNTAEITLPRPSAAKTVDVGTVSDLESLVEEIRRDDAPRILTCDGRAVAVILPLQTTDGDAKKAAGRRRSGVIRPGDALLNIVGMLDEPDPDGATDVSLNKQKYLSDALTSKHP